MLPEHYSSRMGGAEYQALLLVEALCRTQRFDVFYLCQRVAENYIPSGYTIRVAGKKYLPGQFSSFLAVKEVLTELNRIRPDIIYQKVGGILTGIAGYYARKHGVKFIWHIASDDDVVPQWNANLKRAIRTVPERLFLYFGARRTTTIAAQTGHQARLLKEKFGIATASFIPVGHPLPEGPVVKAEKLSVLWVANLKPLKRPEVFVRLAEKFSDRNDVRFVMVGRQGWGGWFQQLQKEMGSLPNFTYAGELPQEQVNELLSQGHILVNTSRYEGFSNTFVQAWLRKVPVVSLTVDPDGLLASEKIGYRSGTFEQLCDDVGALIENRTLREEMGSRAYAYAASHHSVEKMTSSALRLFA